MTLTLRTFDGNDGDNEVGGGGVEGDDNDTMND